MKSKPYFMAKMVQAIANDGKYAIDTGHGYGKIDAVDFEKLYRGSGNMTFGDALVALKAGMAVQREGWNGKGLFIARMPELKLAPFANADEPRRVNDRTAKWIGVDTPLDCRPYFAIYNPANNHWQPGWVPSTSDCLAEDWLIVEVVDEAG